MIVFSKVIAQNHLYYGFYYNKIQKEQSNPIINKSLPSFVLSNSHSHLNIFDSDSYHSISFNLLLHRQLTLRYRGYTIDRIQQIVDMQALPSPAKRIIDKTKHVAKLKTIDLSHQELGALHLQIIIQQNEWQHLEEIQLNNNSLSEEGAKVLRQAQWPCLKSINIATNDLGDTGIQHVSQCNWPELEYISLYCNKIALNGCFFLSQSRWPNLRRISIGNNPLGSAGIRLLTRGNFKLITNLLASDCELDDEAFFAITKSGWSMKYLKLSKNKIHSLKGIDKTAWKELKYLIVDNNSLTEDSLLKILKCEWPAMQTLQLNNNKFTISVRQPGLIGHVVKKIKAERLLF